MSIDINTILRVMKACDCAHIDEPLVSLVFPTPNGAQAQVFLFWREGKSLKDYLRDPILTGKWSLYQAIRSRTVDHKGVKRRLSYVLKPGDELRFITASK